jgi:ribosomal 50S subunit-recycling heat shock protein
MRLDKYLKVSRLIKRRTIANEACDAGRVLVNSKPARASYEVKVGDVIEIGLGSRGVRAKVLGVSETVGKGQASDLYQILSEGPAEH